MPTDPVSTLPEEWKQVAGYEGLYSVSNLGNVRRDAGPWKNRFLRKPRPLKLYLIHNGYLRAALFKDKKRKFHLVGRLVAIAFIPQIEGKNQTNHLNGIRTDNRETNLEWASASDNMRHAFDVLGKTVGRGELSPRAKFTNSDIQLIRKMYDAGCNSKEIANQFQIHKETVTRIGRRITWTQIPE